MVVNGIKKIIGLFIIISVIGFVYEQYSRATTKLEPVGELADVGGYTLHYLKKGDGDATVVFESGSDIGGHLAWYKVQDEVSKFATTISYDRAGLMWSQRGNKARTGENMADELHSLLEKANVKKPYTLVGHSLAGLILRSFVKKYPNEVKSIIFVDASHPEQNKYLDITTEQTPLWLIDYANSIGLIRLFMTQNFPNTKDEDMINHTIKAMTYKGVHTSIEEMNQFDILADEANKISSFNDIPLTIISGNINDKLWMELQEKLLNLSTNSKHIKVQGAGHYIQLDKPNVVVDAIKERL
jgi:pimeloyl-ACP methyl ester carboxylesterase